MIVLSNTSPISNLAIIGQISLLQKIYPQIIIPPTVRTELMRLTSIIPQINTLLSQGWLQIYSVSNSSLVTTYLYLPQSHP